MRTLTVVCLFGILGFAATARATVNEPNGQLVPIDSGGEEQLYTFFSSRGEPIDWLKDSHLTPATFTPLCGFTAEFQLHQAGANLGFGWYNSDPNNNTPPTLAEIHTLIPANSPVGTKINSANIVNDPNYKGGDIGFALIGGQTHYSEKRFNVVCTNCANVGPWVLALIYQSIKTPHAYYVAFEDGSVSNNSFGNDGDFNDDVFLVSGVLCSGAGKPCDTKLAGICGDGLTNCDAGGGLVCKPVNVPAPEMCDGLDNDCNGMVDDAAMCPNNQVCDRGRCVDPCGAGEFQCAGNTTCDNGVCVEPGCVGLRCPAGQVCHGGTCSGACDGVICPNPLTCRIGRCVDPCAGVMCNKDQVCSGGACITSCSCQPCSAANLTCAASGSCVDKMCVMVTCAAGTSCKAGICVDDCTGAVCPQGQGCMMGQCVDVVIPDMGDSIDMEAADDAADDSEDMSGLFGKGARAGCSCSVSARGGGQQWISLLGGIALMGLWIGRRARRIGPKR